MPQITINITPELHERMIDWGRKLNEPPEALALELLEEYFDDCDDADKLYALIEAGKMKTYSMEEVHEQLDKELA